MSLHEVGVKRKYESERRSLKDDEEKRQCRLKWSKYSRQKQRVNKKCYKKYLILWDVEVRNELRS